MKLIMLFSPSFCYFFPYIRIFSSASYFHTPRKCFFLKVRADFTPEKKIKQYYTFAVFAVFVGRNNYANGNLRLEFITLLREVPCCR